MKKVVSLVLALVLVLSVCSMALAEEKKWVIGFANIAEEVELRRARRHGRRGGGSGRGSGSGQQ